MIYAQVYLLIGLLEVLIAAQIDRKTSGSIEGWGIGATSAVVLIWPIAFVAMFGPEISKFLNKER